MTAATAAEGVIAQLAEGNDRFASGRSAHPHTDRKRIARSLTDPPKPVAIVLSCADSRVPTERLFDQGVGDLFVVRVAGNVATGATIGSVELAMGSCPVLVVLGHTGCLAVRTACAGGHQSYAVWALTAQISDVAARVRAGDPTLTGEDLHARVEEANVRRTIADLTSASVAIREAVEGGRVSIVGAIYETDTGRVRWLED